jgi:DNA-binding transcriptional LysR family regulator
MRGSDYADLRAFATIAQLRSYSAAARVLAVSPSALSQRIRDLEARLGVQLLNRTTRSVALSTQGMKLFEKIVPLFEGFEQALNDLAEARHEVVGPLRLNLSRVAAMHLISPLLGEFHRAFPGVTLEIVVDDTFSDIVAKRFDAGIRLGERLERDMVAVKLGGQREAMVVASPLFVAQFGEPQTPADLQRSSCIRFRWPGGRDIYRWEFEKDGNAMEITVDGPLIANDSAIMLMAAQQGLGFAYVLDVEARSLVETGSLMRVLTDWTPPFGGFYLYHPNSRHMPRPLRLFIDFLKMRMSIL